MEVVGVRDDLRGGYRVDDVPEEFPVAPEQDRRDVALAVENGTPRRAGGAVAIYLHEICEHLADGPDRQGGIGDHPGRTAAFHRQIFPQRIPDYGHGTPPRERPPLPREARDPRGAAANLATQDAD